MRLLYEEAKNRADAINHGIVQMDDRAHGLVRFNMLVFGLTLTAVSILHDGPRPGTPWISTIFTIGLVGILASTLLAVSAYLKKGLAAGIDVKSLVAALGYDVDKPQLQTQIIKAYSIAIVKDEQAIERASRRFRAALQALVLGLVALTIGTAMLLTQGGAL